MGKVSKNTNGQGRGLQIYVDVKKLVGKIKPTKYNPPKMSENAFQTKITPEWWKVTEEGSEWNAWNADFYSNQVKGNKELTSFSKIYSEVTREEVLIIRRQLRGAIQ